MSNIHVRSANLDKLEIGPLNARYSARGDRILRYQIDIRHKVLNLHKEVSAPEVFILQSKVDALMDAWDAKFEEQQRRTMLRSGKDAADEATADAALKQEALRRILAHTLGVNDAVDWDSLKDRTPYKMPKHFPEAQPKLLESEPPQRLAPSISFLDTLFGKKKQKLQDADAAHERAIADWQAEERAKKIKYDAALTDWQSRKSAFWADHKRQEARHLEDQAARNGVVDDLRDNLKRGEAAAVIEHASLVLDASDYGGLFEKSFNLQYHAHEKLILVAYDLPCPDTLPTIKSVRFIKATGEMKETLISERDRKTNFEAAAYQICLRTIHELFEADEFGNVAQVLFNGHVTAVDRRTGQDVRSCLLSILVKREEFARIDLSKVDPKTCFKSLKGVSAAQLASLTAIPPRHRHGHGGSPFHRS